MVMRSTIAEREITISELARLRDKVQLNLEDDIELRCWDQKECGLLSDLKAVLNDLINLKVDQRVIADKWREALRQRKESENNGE